ncbi:MAG: OB-fold nucleic acid binding domain-containing protein, partial [Vibrio fluvialis]
SFAVLAYCSAWLKYYYPEAFYTALLNSLPMGFYSASQLVQDAQRHGIAVLPVCVNASQWDHQVVEHDQQWAMRLGLRQVKGFSEQGAQLLLSARPAQGFHHPAQLKRCGLTQKDMESLASANALHSFAHNRYATRWTMMDSLSDLPLFEQLEEAAPALYQQPSDMDTLVEDYASLGLSLTQHPVTLLDTAGELGRFTRMRDLIQLPHKSLVTVAGIVTGRQSPGTAAGVTFFTLEDDTGNINVVVWQATARAQKSAYISAKMLMVKGILEREGSVIHVIAGRLIDLTPKLHQLHTQSRDFH